MRVVKRGFTLIEMLVVISIIGIMSVFLMTAMSPARNKAKDTRIVSGMNQIRSYMETTYDPLVGVYGGSIDDPLISDISDDISRSGGDSFTFSNIGTAYAVSVSLNSGDTYCLDSLGTENSQEAKDGTCSVNIITSS